MSEIVASKPAVTRRLPIALTPALVVFCGGANLILIQWVMVRELTTLLMGTELVILLVTVTYFAGLSIGYALSNRIPQHWLKPLAALTLILHLALPIWFRLIVAGLETAGIYGAAFFVMPIITPLGISAFYSIFLPRYADSGEGALWQLYALEVAGSAVGVLLLVTLGGISLTALYAVYAAVLLVLLLALGESWRLVIVLAAGCLLWLAALPSLNLWSNTLWYQSMYGLPVGTTTLYSGYSPYQKVDVLAAPNGGRLLFLDGMEHFGTGDGSWLNVVMGRVPASLSPPENALVFGAGSMQLELMIANYAGHVTTVEIDPVVLDVSQTYFDSYNQMSRLENRTLVVDDARHYIANTAGTYDLIATDLPAAFTVQTAALYTQPFFEQVAQHLAADGVFSVNLTSTFTPDDDISRRVAAGLLATFDEVIVVTSNSAGWSFAYASNNLPFSRDALVETLQTTGENQYAVFETSAVSAIVGDATPLTVDTLDVVLQISGDRLANRIGLED